MRPALSGMRPKSKDISKRFRQNWLEQLDFRTNLARDLKDRYTALCNDLGGIERLSYAQRSLAERCIWLERYVGLQEQEMLEEHFDPRTWILACNSLLNIYSRLGLERRARDIPTLHEYIARQ
jgi:hypothetical protein